MKQEEDLNRPNAHTFFFTHLVGQLTTDYMKYLHEIGDVKILS